MILRRFTQLPLRYKMMLPTWFMVMLLVGLIGTPAIHLLVLSQRDAQEQRISILSQGVAATLQAALMFDDPITAKEQLVNLNFDPVIIAAKVVNETGEQIAHIDQLPNACYWLKDQLLCDEVSFATVETDISMLGERLGTLVVWESLEGLEKQEQELFGYLGMLALAVSLFSWLFARVLHGLIVTPLNALHESMEQTITQGMTKQSIEIYHDDEIGKLTTCFNDMIANLLDREAQLQSALLSVEQKNRYIHSALDAMKRGVMVVSPGNKVDYCNPVANQIFSDQHLNNTRIAMESNFEPKSAIEMVLNAVEHHLSLSSVELRAQSSEQRYHVSCHPLKEVGQSLLQFQDVTQINIAEKRRMLLELMFDQFQDAILVLDRNLNVETQNNTALQWFGELASVHELVFKQPMHINQKMRRDLLNAGLLFGEIEIKHQSKRWMPYELKARALKGKDGRVEAFVISITDLSVGIELKRLDFAANHDPLTGLANRSKALKYLQDRHNKGESQFIFFLDLDGFKAVNDRYGHGVGDDLLCIVAKRLEGCISAHDLVSRIAGDEFLIGIRGTNQCQPIAQRIIETLSNPIVINGQVCNVTASLGISYWSANDGSIIEDKIQQADSNMYTAKRLGKNRFYYTQ
ncbi:diguanylate cyclase domain-containing protein [Vibrio fluminensis]|uniref:diguanylate cyclase domain-containing protein n=1 Tax=Vibrio fluminensis TaxID=2783614 RepID=UPI0018873BC2|nr:diguanylate cyclase [Vibrio fluminensis]